ncbi:MAG: ribosome-associated translation inhibitor RaiA [Candidatus Caenarcaniphilales bacterium]|nr:ribosome-associated translation inhibitor RaiA [Candidatus Caenarcaniphilales bacterium]
MKKVDIHGMNLDITQAIEQYIVKKVDRATKHTAEFVSGVRVNLSCENKSGTHLVEIVLFMNGGKTLHNKTRSEDMYASIDIACAGIERQLRKIKEKNIDVKRYRSMEEKLISAPDLLSSIAS